MPTLDDAPIINPLLGGEVLTAGAATADANIQKEDLVQVYDMSERQAKTITVDELAKALGITLI